MLLPHADEEGLAVVAEGLARVIPACSIDVGDGVVHPTASIGFTLLHQRSGDLREVLDRSRAGAERRQARDRLSRPKPTLAGPRRDGQ